MQTLFDAIAEDKTLQAAAIIITLGSFVIFITKLIIPAIRFVYNVFKSGYNRAYVKSLRKIIYRARLDVHDARLIISSFVLLLFQAIVSFLFPVMIIVTLELISRDLDRYGIIENQVKETPPEWWIWVISIPIGFTFAYFSLYPAVRLYLYMKIVRRKLLREILMGRFSS